MTGHDGDTARHRRPLRVDAQRNEDRLLVAAGAFARERADVSVKDIAHAAGAGAGRPSTPLGAGPQRAARPAAQALHDGQDAEATADRVLDAAPAVGHLDDVAVLVIRRVDE